MANLAKRIPAIIKKLDGARAALEELSDLLPREDGCRAIDGRCQLASALSEYADYLEKATWWKQSITARPYSAVLTSDPRRKQHEIPSGELDH